jgi:hypothetical protein
VCPSSLPALLPEHKDTEIMKKLDPEALAEMQEDFAFNDADGDGRITFEEFCDLLEDLESEASPEEVAARFPRDRYQRQRLDQLRRVRRLVEGAVAGPGLPPYASKPLQERWLNSGGLAGVRDICAATAGSQRRNQPKPAGSVAERRRLRRHDAVRSGRPVTTLVV